MNMTPLPVKPPPIPMATPSASNVASPNASAPGQGSDRGPDPDAERHAADQLHGALTAQQPARPECYRRRDRGEDRRSVAEHLVREIPGDRHRDRGLHRRPEVRPQPQARRPHARPQPGPQPRR